MANSSFVIPVHDLDAAGSSYRFPIPTSWLSAALEGTDTAASTDEGVLEVRASKSGNDVVVQGRLVAGLVMPCARCTQPASLTIDKQFTVLFVPAAGGARVEAEYEFGAEEADLATYDGDTAVLDEVARDELLLEVPMIPLCSDDCPGITPRSAGEGAGSREAEIDLRLLPLMQFRNPKKE